MVDDLGGGVRAAVCVDPSARHPLASHLRGDPALELDELGTAAMRDGPRGSAIDVPSPRGVEDDP